MGTGVALGKFVEAFPAGEFRGKSKYFQAGLIRGKEEPHVMLCCRYRVDWGSSQAPLCLSLG